MSEIWILTFLSCSQTRKNTLQYKQKAKRGRFSRISSESYEEQPMSDCSEPFLPDAQQFKSRSSSLSRPSSEICLPVARDNSVVSGNSK